MLSINTSLSSIVANSLSLASAAVAQATQRLSTGLRINSAADDPAGLGIATSMLAQINGLTQGVANANDAVSMVQTASSGLSSITSSLQDLNTLAVKASSSTLTSSARAALQQQADQDIAQINSVVGQTSYNGKNLLNGSTGTVAIQVGANVGQTVSLNFSTAISAASLGNGVASSGTTLGTFSNVSLASDGTAASSSTTAAITAVNVLADGNGGFTFTDQNGATLSSTAVSNLFTVSTSGSTSQLALASGSAISGTAASTTVSTVNTANTPTSVAGIDLSSVGGASQALVALGNALASVSSQQAKLGASQSLLSGIATTQTSFATDLTDARSQIMDADVAQETANLAKAQAQQQTDAMLLTQANAQSKLVLELLAPTTASSWA